MSLEELPLEVQVRDLQERQAILQANYDQLRSICDSQQVTNRELIQIRVKQDSLIKRLYAELEDVKHANKISGETSTSDRFHYLSRLELGPESGSLKWTGTATDIIPVEINGRDAVALIFPLKMQQEFIHLARMTFKYSELNQHVCKARAVIKRINDRLRQNKEMFPNTAVDAYDGQDYSDGERPISADRIANYERQIGNLRQRIALIKPVLLATIDEMDPVRGVMDHKIRKRFIKAGMFSWGANEQWLEDVWRANTAKEFRFWEFKEEQRKLQDSVISEEDEGEASYHLQP